MVPKFVVPPGARIGDGVAPADASRISHGNIFDEAILANHALGHRRSYADWLISFWVHAAVVAVLVILPLFYSQVIDLKKFETTYLAAPPTLSAPPPPAVPVAALVRQPLRKVPTSTAKLTMPIAIPKVIPKPASAPEAPPEMTAGIPGGIPGGVPGGEIGGMLGGMLGGTGANLPPPQPVKAAPPAPTASGPLRVGGNVKRPKEIYKPAPRYPALAKQSRIQGEVEIDAVIDKDGNVVQAHVMDGPPLLIGAALEAVKQWKYEPTYLNGVPWPIELTIHVTFSLAT